MIKSFKCRDTERLFEDRKVPRFRNIERMARRRLAALDAAHTIEDLRTPPGNRLERLSGRRKGQLSIRINDRWRICFLWTEGGPRDVEIVDYH